MIKIPNETKKFKQVNDSDVLGNIWSSFGLDLTDNIGRILVAPRLVSTTLSNQSGKGDLELPVAFRIYTGVSDTKIWMMSGEFMWYNDGKTDSTFVKDDTDESPTVNPTGDMELFNGALYTKAGSEINKYDGGWNFLYDTFGGDCQMASYNERLYFTMLDSQIGSLDLSDALATPSGTPNLTDYTLQLSDFGVGGSSANYITSIRASSNRIWISTMDRTATDYSAGRGAKIFEWDGASNRVTKVYNIDSVGVLALIIKDDLPYAVDVDGRLLAYNGGSFTVVARLPLNPSQYLKNPLGQVQSRWIHPRGIALRNGRILILVRNLNNDSNETINENLPSGIWEFDPNIGLYHKYAISYLENGDSEIMDYGQNRIAYAGALFNAKSSSIDNVNGDLIAGSAFYLNDSDTEVYGTFINDIQENYRKTGYLVSPLIESQNVEDMYQKAYVKYKKFIDEADKIVFKYTFSQDSAKEITVDWTSETVFTTNADISDYSIGNEIEVTQGTGGGMTAHITDIQGVSPSTVTLDTTITGATDSSKVRLQKWNKCGEATGQYSNYKSFPISAPNTFIRIKMVMYFTGKNEVQEVQLINTTNVKSE